ncbi:MAG: hypothetical protein ACYCQI_15115 [Gammaproteobacteria bacterium]
MPKPEEYDRVEKIVSGSDYTYRLSQDADPSLPGVKESMDRRMRDLTTELARLSQLEKKEGKEDYQFHHNSTLLMLAARKNAAFAIGPLLDFKNDLHAKNADGLSAIAIAVRHGNVETAKMLFDCGASLGDIFEQKIPSSPKSFSELRLKEGKEGSIIIQYPQRMISAFESILQKGELDMIAFLEAQISKELDKLKRDPESNHDAIEYLEERQAEVYEAFVAGAAKRNLGVRHKLTDDEVLREVPSVIETSRIKLQERLQKVATFQPPQFLQDHKDSLAGRKERIELHSVDKENEASRQEISRRAGKTKS